jgi:hypothetical protein
MALTKCSECGRDVSSLAAACPNCGAPVQTENPPPHVPALQNPKHKTWKFWLVPGLIVAFALLKLAATVTDWTASSKPDHVDFSEVLKKNPPKIDLFIKNSDGGKYFKELATKHPEIMAQTGARAMTALNLNKIRDALTAYRRRNGSFPSNDQGLGVLLTAATDPVATSAALSRIEMMDGWGSDYIYRIPGAKHPDSYDLFSSGPDRLPDTEDDYWGD